MYVKIILGSIRGLLVVLLRLAEACWFSSPWGWGCLGSAGQKSFLRQEFRLQRRLGSGALVPKSPFERERERERESEQQMERDWGRLRWSEANVALITTQMVSSMTPLLQELAVKVDAPHQRVLPAPP